MKKITGILNFREKLSSGSGLLLLTTLAVIGASEFVYSTMVYEKTLNVNNPTGAPTGLATPAVAAFSLIAIVIMSLSGLVTLIIFAFLVRWSSTRTDPDGQESISTIPVPPPREETDAGELNPSNQETDLVSPGKQELDE